MNSFLWSPVSAANNQQMQSPFSDMGRSSLAGGYSLGQPAPPQNIYNSGMGSAQQVQTPAQSPYAPPMGANPPGGMTGYMPTPTQPAYRDSDAPLLSQPNPPPGMLPRTGGPDPINSYTLGPIGPGQQENPQTLTGLGQSIPQGQGQGQQPPLASLSQWQGTNPANMPGGQPFGYPQPFGMVPAWYGGNGTGVF